MRKTIHRWGNTEGVEEPGPYQADPSPPGFVDMLFHHESLDGYQVWSFASTNSEEGEGPADLRIDKVSD